MRATIEVNNTANQVHTVAKQLGTNVTLTKVTPSEVRSLMRKAGTKIASVHFKKRSDKSLRKMCYRLGVTNPKTANAPKGTTTNGKSVNGKSANRRAVDTTNNQITVYDVNKVVRNRDGAIEYDENGKRKRGAWRTVPLENVTRVCVDGVTYQIAR